jgi:hypothetical protein
MSPVIDFSSLASARSTSFTTPSALKSVFSGRMSRWISPARWAASSPAAICIATSTTWPTSSVPCCRISRAPVVPSMYSITR